jgi:alkylhydroperoxidase family enzyme
MSCHAEFLRVALGGDDKLSRAIIGTASGVAPELPKLCTSRQRMLVELVRLVATTPWTLTRQHRTRAHAAGVDDEALLHTIALAAYFGHLNRIADATAVPLDYVVQVQGIPANPATPALEAAPRPLAGRPALDIAKRPATATALAAWRTYIVQKDAPLTRRQRVLIARWVATWLGDGGISPPDDLTANPLDDKLRSLAEIVTLAPWQLCDDSFAELRAEGLDDTALFDVCATASSFGVFSRIEVALVALAS